MSFETRPFQTQEEVGTGFAERMAVRRQVIEAVGLALGAPLKRGRFGPVVDVAGEQWFVETDRNNRNLKLGTAVGSFPVLVFTLDDWYDGPEETLKRILRIITEVTS